MNKTGIQKWTFKEGEAENNKNLSDELGIPVYHIYSMHAFNRIVGYARFIYASEGTVLYRGQGHYYHKLIPSGLRSGKEPVAEKTITDIREDTKFRRFFNLDHKDIKDRDQYESVLVEAILQHYGAKTHCMDFVDNHWCALWFGLYEFKHNHYRRRTDSGNIFIYLYVADTLGPCVRGMYDGTDTLTIDLRKAVPSTFQRPASQHGWIIRNRDQGKQDLNDGLVAILEVSVPDADKWLGEGALLSEENFFPSFKYDQGYHVLLERQTRSGLSARSKQNVKILPMDTIQNYHFSDLIYSEVNTSAFKPCCSSGCNNSKSDDPLADMASWLWRYGWQRETSIQEAIWNEEEPNVGQSGATALLVQRYYGGEIAFVHYAQRQKYLNLINGKMVDLACGELRDREFYQEAKQVSNRQYSRIQTRFSNRAEILDKAYIEAITYRN